MKNDPSKGATPLDANEIAGLILVDISTQNDLNRYEEENILQAQLWASKSRSLKKNLLSIGGLCRLHREMFSDVWQWAGTFRTSEKNMGVAPHQIQIQLDQLCKNISLQLEEESKNMDLVAVNFHHGLTRIHPFPNGNGRHARLSADILLSQNAYKPFTWSGKASLLKDSTSRSEYIKALQEADTGNMQWLLEFARS